MSQPSNTDPPKKEPWRRDPWRDPNFIPCRDERCTIEHLHREHHIDGRTRGPNKKGKRLHA